MKKLSALFATAAAYLLLAPMSFADVNVNPCVDSTQNQFGKLCGLQASNTPSLIKNIVVFLLVGAVIIALFFLIYGGIRWILSGGDKGKVEAARNTIVAAIIGLIVAFLAYFILSLVLNLFGLSLTNLTLPQLTP